MIKVLFFAQVRELVGTDTLEVADDFPTVSALRQHLAANGGRRAPAREDGTVPEAGQPAPGRFDYSVPGGRGKALFPPGGGG